jgi:phosphatidylglycerophosphatase A
VIKKPKGEWATIRSQQLNGADYGALALATWGVGLIPFAPGTWGSAVGVALFVAWRGIDSRWQAWAQTRGLSATGAETLEACAALALVLALFLGGIWAASRLEKLTGKKDPSVVIVDEIAGQLITYLFLPRAAGWGLLLAGFLLFRLFDILKPFPAGPLEDLPGGLGGMADDAMAGIYAAVSLLAVASVVMLVT